MRRRLINWLRKPVVLMVVLTTLATPAAAYATLGVATKRAAVVPGVNLKDGLVGWWKMDGNAKDSSGYNNNGVFSGGTAATTDRNGRANAAMTFDGTNGAMTIPASPTLNNGSITVGFWFTATVNPDCDAGNNYRVMMRKTNMTASAVDGWDLVYEQSMSPQFDVGFGGATHRRQNNMGITVGTPRYLTYSYDGATGARAMYANGVLVYSDVLATPAPIDSNNYPLIIAGGSNAQACPSGGSGYTPGTYDDVRLYSRALSGTEVTALYGATDVESPANSPVKIDAAESGLVGQWNLDGTGKDDTPFADNGTVVSATATTDRKGVAASAMTFNGAASVSVPNAAALNQNNAVTVSAWIKPTTIGPFTNGSATIVQKRTDSSQQPYSLVMNDGGGLHAAWKVSAGGDVNGWASVTAPGVLQLNKWQHVAFTRDATSATLYLNGVAAATSGYGFASNPPSANALPLNIGGSTSQFSGFSGSIDDVRLYSRALTTSQLQQQYGDYNSQVDVGSLQKGLVGYWPFNGNAKDATPNANNGIVSGASLAADRKGRAASAYRFDDTLSNYVDVGAPSAYSNLTSSGFTYSIWLMRTGLSTNQWPVIMGAQNTHIYYGLRAFSYGATLQFEYGNSPFAGATWSGLGGMSVPVNQWCLATITYSGTSLKFYFNGVLWGSVSATLNPAFGAITFSRGSYFNGYLDDARVYNRALSAAEVAQLFTEYR